MDLLATRFCRWLLPDAVEGSSLLADVILDVAEFPQFQNVTRICMDIVEQRSIAALSFALFASAEAPAVSLYPTRYSEEVTVGICLIRRAYVS